ncbi:hypothetical protein GQ602_002243 [Ophiocordyceps camponoti-floridani]|uniref:Uncharacterized protein n=1 Tax=Ophiocordyceps camponoti-floridani TaxID=2030778 RepID=A0A8H4VFG1_9HYPO|nr:hypothetical protein GQ602_002243 [Ophiocordyceps camponoti-floridani]
MSGCSKRSSLGVIAHVEDAADEDAFEGNPKTRKYATANDGPTKQRPNTSKSRADKRPSLSSSSSSSDSTARSSENKVKEARRPSRADAEPPPHRRAAPSSPAKPVAPRKIRPQPPKPASSSAVPVVQQQSYARGRVEDPAYYGVKQSAAPPSRPRAQTRPVTYYAGQTSPHGIMGPGPAWIPGHGPGPGPQQQFPVGSFPPPPTWSPGGPLRPPLGYVHPPLQQVGPLPGYFESPLSTSPHNHNRLRHRFDSRPSSALGFRVTPAIDYHDDPLASRVMRRPSRSQRNEEDAARMPPPNFIPKRPQSAAPPPATPFRPPPLQQRPPSRQNQSRPPPANRRPIPYETFRRDDDDSLDDDDDDDDDEDGAVPLFNDLSPQAPNEQRRAMVARQGRASAVYDQQGYAVVPATRRRRRSSLYATGPCGSGGASLGESKLNAAIKYQNDVNGGAKLPLTAETLRKATKRGGVPSSRSTRSSGSRDDSEYRRSNTTSITRSACGNESITVKMSPNTVFRLDGAEMECANSEGGEITWIRGISGGDSRAGSDRASTVYQQIDDSRRISDGRHSERLERSPVRTERKALPVRPRAPSQADSQSRGGYAPTTYAPYEPAYEYATGHYI